MENHRPDLLFMTASLELKARVASSLLAKVMRAEPGSPSNWTWTLTRFPYRLKWALRCVMVLRLAGTFLTANIEHLAPPRPPTRPPRPRPNLA